MPLLDVWIDNLDGTEFQLDTEIFGSGGEILIEKIWGALRVPEGRPGEDLILPDRTSLQVKCRGGVNGKQIEFRTKRTKFDRLLVMAWEPDRQILENALLVNRSVLHTFAVWRESQKNGYDITCGKEFWDLPRRTGYDGAWDVYENIRDHMTARGITMADMFRQARAERIRVRAKSDVVTT
jgi:hypothetical protein